MQPTPPHQDAIPAARPVTGWFERGIFVATLMVCAIALAPNVADVDLWGHVQYGRDLLRDGLPATTTYSFTAEGYRWINHENLSEILLAVGADSVGPIGLLIAKCLLGICVIALIMHHAAHHGVGLFASCIVSIMVAVNLTYHWGARPQLFSYVSFALLLALLEYCFHGWSGSWRLQLPFGRQQDGVQLPEYSSRRMRYLWLAPPLFFLWTNAHGGFVAGLCIYLAYLAFRSLEAFSLYGKAALPVISRWLMMMAAAILATLVNPYGPHLHLWLLESLTVPRPEIVEWHAPNLTESIFVPFWLMLALAALAVGFSRKSRDMTHLFVWGVILWQSLQHQRHIAFLTIAFGFWMVVHVDGLLRRLNLFQTGSESAAPRMSRLLRGALVSAFVGTFLLLSCRLYSRLNDMPVKRAEYPVSAFEFMARHQLKGRLVVTYNWAQYALAAFGTEHPQSDGITVAFDGRFRTCYPQELVDAHFDFIAGTGDDSLRYRSPTSPPFNDSAVLSHLDPNLVLINRFQPHSIEVMSRNQGEWTLLYQDALAQLWGRRSCYDDPTSANYLPPTARSITDTAQEGSITWPAFPWKQPTERQVAHHPDLP